MSLYNVILLKYINRIVGGTQTLTYDDTPTLEHIGFENGNHVFKSLGVFSKDEDRTSNLFPEGDETKYTLLYKENGTPVDDIDKVPLRKNLTISEKVVQIISSSIHCIKGKRCFDDNESRKCKIRVKEVK